MASRDVLDNRIDVWKDQYKDNQGVWRANQSTTGNYGQVLRGNIRPSDQPADGPLLPATLRNDGWIDVYEAPNGFGWRATFEADEGTLYRRTLGVHEDGPIVETSWVVYEEPIFPESSETPIGLMSAMPAETLWDKTKRYAAIVWEAVKHPIKTLQRRA